MAKAESKTILKAYSTVESKLPTLPLEDGQLIFVYDKKKIILDNHGVRTVYEQIQTIETEEQRNDLLAPIDSFYFVIETSILWRYSNGHWNQITTSPQEQIDRISAEGTKQVKAVQDKGAEVLQSIPEDFTTQMETKLDKQQGIENKGKVLVIGEDGNVVPGEVQSGGGDGIAIINTMSGESPLMIPDSTERVNKGLELGGKTDQVQTSGKNLLNEELLKTLTNYTSNETDYYYYRFSGLEVGKKYTISRGDVKTGKNTLLGISVNQESTNKAKFLVYDGLGTGYNNASITWEQTTGEYVDILFSVSGSVTSTTQERLSEFWGRISYVQLEKGATATPYEPYTGGKPSPSPEYPQEIKSVGKWNESTQKYEVDVKVVGKNLFDREKAKDNSNWIIKSNDGYAKFPIYVKKGNKITFSYTEKLTTGKKFYLGISLSDAGSTVAWLYHDTTASLINNKYTIAATNDYIYLMCSKSDIQNFVDTIQTLQVEISPTQTDYQPYAEQFLTLTSDRPLTKWDKLVEQGGQIGWLYKSAVVKNFNGDGYKIQSAGNIGNVNKYIIVFPDALIKGKASADIYVDRYRGIIASYAKEEYGICCNWNDGIKYFNAPNETVKTVDDFKKWLTENPLTIAYETETTEFVPLPQEEQNAIRALKTYYPTTVITVDGGELDPDIKVTYTADTKNYIDNKFGKTINAMQTKLLELESRV